MNLQLRDKKDRLFRFAVHEDRVLDLKTLHTRIGANGRLGFASPERMLELLGVPPRALTPLALINDTAGVVAVIVDASLQEAEQINFHSLINEESTGLHPTELVALVRSCGREPMIVDFVTGSP